jgi:hypothetical protein
MGSSAPSTLSGGSRCGFIGHEAAWATGRTYAEGNPGMVAERYGLSDAPPE